MVVLHEPLIAFQQVFACFGSHLVGKQITLVNEFHVLVHRAGLQDLIEGIDVVCHGVKDLSADAPQVVSHRLVLAQIAINRDAFDQRADGVAHLSQWTAIVHRGERDVFAVQVFPEHQRHGSHEEAAFGDVHFVAEGFNALCRQGSGLIADIPAHARRQRPVQLSVQGRHVLCVPEKVFIVFFCFFVAAVTEQALLVHRRLLDRVILSDQLLAG